VKTFAMSTSHGFLHLADHRGRGEIWKSGWSETKVLGVQCSRRESLVVRGLVLAVGIADERHPFRQDRE
jgi:hypothetical protein